MKFAFAFALCLVSLAALADTAIGTRCARESADERCQEYTQYVVTGENCGTAQRCMRELGDETCAYFNTEATCGHTCTDDYHCARIGGNGQCLYYVGGVECQ